MLMADHAGPNDFRRRQHDATDRRLRTRVAATARLPGRSSASVVPKCGNAGHVHIPIGKAVARGDDRRVGSDQRRHRRDGVGNRVGLERDDQIVLDGEVGGRVRAAEGARCALRRRSAAARHPPAWRQDGAPRATRLTSAPEAANWTPRNAPIAPAPKMHTFNAFPVSGGLGTRAEQCALRANRPTARLAFPADRRQSGFRLF